jgi:trimeric autotransporter adhesin
MNLLRLALVLTSLAHACELAAANLPQGYVVGWGANLCGEVTGVATRDFSTGAVRVAGSLISNAVAISAGWHHSLALTSQGTVAGWGWNHFGQAVGVASGNLANSNGFVTIDGLVLSNVTAISAGRTHSLALKRDGTVVAWGAYWDGEKVTVPAGLSNVAAISAGKDESLALKRDGSLVLWGLGNKPPETNNMVAVSAGLHSTDLALRADSTVCEWMIRAASTNSTVPAGLSNVVAISAGCNHSLALKRDGTVVGWGANGSGQATGIATTVNPYFGSGPGVLRGQALTNVVAVAAGEDFSLVLRFDGTLVAWGDLFGVQPAVVPTGLRNVVAIAAGPDFCLAITTNSSLVPALVLPSQGKRAGQ